jgi:amino acid adenylation domain-containing protein
MGEAVQLLERLESLGVEMSCRAGQLHYAAPKGAIDDVLREQMRQHKAALMALLERGGRARKGDAARRTFAMSPLQQAYWIGETPLYGTACIPYLYSEYELEALSLDAFQAAVNELVWRHGALRLRNADDGNQWVDDHVTYRATVIDLGDAPRADAEAALALHRQGVEEMLRLATRPFQFTVHRLPGHDVVSFAFKLAVVDGVSFNLLLDELVNLYEGKRLAAPSPRVYSDYIDYLEDRRTTRRYREARAYWSAQLAHLPPPPQIPFVEGEAPGVVRFERQSGYLLPEDWHRLKTAAQCRGVPINSVLCGVYCDVLARWSSRAEFTLNVLFSDRPSLPGMDTLVGNCSTTMLLGVRHDGANFVDRGRALQARIFENMEHACVAGVDLIRELQARQGATSRPPMPVVFTSGIGLASGLKGFVIRREGWKHVHGHLKTSQVWLDHQVYEDEGRLVFNWDHVASVFPAGVVEAMFEAYDARLRELACNTDAWTDASRPQLPQAHRKRLAQINGRHCPLPEELLHQRFATMARQRPSAIALIEPHRAATYGELHARATGIGLRLQKVLGPAGGHIVGVHALKGADQIATVLGVLMSGNIYLPLDAKLPPARLRHIVSHSEARVVLVDAFCGARLGEALEVPAFCVDDIAPSGTAALHGSARPDDRAYVIYTSGSTGQPKGVVISHRAAMNTLDDMARRFGMAPEDVVLGLSSLNFDLSVYDIFCTLSHGAALLLPPEQDVPDPTAWLDLVLQHRATVWNSVPALMEISLDHLGGRAAHALASLRAVLLSGDWIPQKLVAALKSYCPDVALIGLGGATEAAIWSNFHRIEGLQPGWTSVPYGTPLSNQSMQVLDARMDDCPEWVTGDLYIGGAGLAEGYLNAPEKTAASFVSHPTTGERMYRTGDLARFREGMIEFLGRKDFQVKVRGYRVELGEIESRMNELPGVDASVAILDGRDSAAQRLMLFYTARAKAPLQQEIILAHLRQHLPHYMVPATVQFLERMPLSANAKVDRQRLLALLPERDPVDAGMAPGTVTEIALGVIWQELLGLERIHRGMNFFQAGGNSLQLVRLATRIRERLGVDVPLPVLMQQQQLDEQATWLDRTEQTGRGVLVQLSEGRGKKQQLFLLHPVGGYVLCYQPLAQMLPDHALFGIQGTFGKRSQRAHSLDDMAQRYADAIATESLGDPVHLGGWSMGAVLALAVARRLEQSGHAVAPLLLIDPWVASPEAAVPWCLNDKVRAFFTDILGERAALPIQQDGERAGAYLARCHAHLSAGGGSLGLGTADLEELFEAYESNSTLLRGHLVAAPDAPIYLAKASEAGSSFHGLQPLSPAAIGVAHDRLHVREFNATHWTLMSPACLRPIVDGWLSWIEHARRSH